MKLPLPPMLCCHPVECQPIGVLREVVVRPEAQPRDDLGHTGHGVREQVFVPAQSMVREGELSLGAQDDLDAFDPDPRVVVDEASPFLDGVRYRRQRRRPRPGTYGVDHRVDDIAAIAYDDEESCSREGIDEDVSPLRAVWLLDHEHVTARVAAAVTHLGEQPTENQLAQGASPSIDVACREEVVVTVAEDIDGARTLPLAGGTGDRADRRTRRETQVGTDQRLVHCRDPRVGCEKVEQPRGARAWRPDDPHEVALEGVEVTTGPPSHAGSVKERT